MNRKRAIVTAHDGSKTAVIRPRSSEGAELACAIAELAVQKNSPQLLAELPKTVGDYRFMGYLARRDPRRDRGPGADRYCIVDEQEQYVGEIQRGDSFVSYDELARSSTPVGSA